MLVDALMGALLKISSDKYNKDQESEQAEG